MKLKPCSALILTMAIAALWLLLPTGPALAQEDIAVSICEGNFPPDADYDQDGIRNEEECIGLVKNVSNVFLTVPGYDPTNPASLNPARPDLFVILVRASDRETGKPSFLPSELFQYVEKPMADGGLGIKVHQIPYDPDGRALLRNDDKTNLFYRTVISRTDGTFQKAMKIEESLNPASYEMAKCLGQWGTPNGGDDCWVYSQKIINNIAEICGNFTDQCVDDITRATFEDLDLNNIPDLAEVFMRDTVAHECGHDLKLRDVYDAKTGGWHYAARDKVMMSQYIDYRAGRKGVTFYIANKYAAPPDADKATLWEELQP